MSIHLIILESLRQTSLPCWCSYILFNSGFEEDWFCTFQLCRNWFFIAITGYNFLVIDYRLLQLLDFVENDVSDDHNPYVCCIIKLVTTGGVIPYKYHQFSLIVQLVSKHPRNMSICYGTQNSQTIQAQFKSIPWFLGVIFSSFFFGHIFNNIHPWTHFSP